jgi:hypothetical protein
MDITNDRIGKAGASRVVAFAAAVITTALVTTSTALVFTASAGGNGARVAAASSPTGMATIRNI